MSLVCVLLKRLQEVADGGLFRCFPRTLLFWPRNYTSLCRHPTFFGRPTLSQISPTFQSDLGCSLDEIQISNSIFLNWWEGIFNKKVIGKKIKKTNKKINLRPSILLLCTASTSLCVFDNFWPTFWARGIQMTSDLCLFPESNPHVTPPTILCRPIFQNTNTNYDDFALVPSVELTHHITNKD